MLYIVSKITIERHILSKTKGHLSPRIYDKLEIAKKDSVRWLPTWMGNLDVSSFEVECNPKKFKVNIKEETWACRVWDLIGVSCVHAIVIIRWENQRLEEFVNENLTKETFTKAY